ncbi:hypothetical protein AJ88_26855 [Mesorhizobium amorphae CCBAU 01583]|nr:hypothetical protein AJ88_26855 [Mesorhizobium amorphae CCBAU 01583]
MQRGGKVGAAPSKQALFKGKGGFCRHRPVCCSGLMAHSHIMAVRLKPLYDDLLPQAGARLRNNHLDRQHVIPVRL